MGLGLSIHTWAQVMTKPTPSQSEDKNREMTVISICATNVFSPG